jgi:toxin CptA
MSIAVSVIARPSRIHRLLLGGCSLAQAGAALAVGIVTSGRFPAATWLALMLAATAAGLMCSVVQRPKTHRIDISGTGELRVTVQQNVRVPGAARVAAGAPAAGAPAVLLPGSVVWPMLVVLRHAVPGAAAGVLMVWRDSVDAATWRALAVALAVIGRRGNNERFDKIR